MKNFSQELFEKYQKALEAAGVGLWEWQPSTGKIKWDLAFQQLYEMPEDLFEGHLQEFYSFIHPDDRVELAAYVENSVEDENEINTVFRALLRNGKIKNIRTHGYFTRDNTNKVGSVVGLNWDVTHESNLQKDLNQTKSFLENLMNAIPDPVFVKDSSHKWIFGNTEFEKIIGKTKEHYIGKSDYDFFPKEIADKYWNQDNDVLMSNVPSEFEESYVTIDGNPREILTKKSSYYIAKNEKILIGVIRDITDKNIIDSRFRTIISLIDSSADLFSFTDYTGIPMYVNKAGQDIFGIEPGKHYFTHYFSDPDRNRIDEEVRKSLAENERWEGETIALNPKTKEKIPVLLKIFSVRSGPGDRVFYGCSGTNLTEVKKIQKSMIEQSKMASLGEMAAAIAHEVNNPLMIVQAKSQMLQAKVSESHPEKEKILRDLKLIEKNSIRIDKIIKSLKTASRRSDQDPYENVPLLSIIEESVELSSQRFRHAEISLKVSENHVCDLSHVVHARSTEVVQVLVNLLNNSFDAVKNLDDRWVEIYLDCHSSYYEVAVIDSGVRIRDEVTEKMFEPFYTTKPSGQGTGLGLSLSKQIVQAHGGDFYYDSKAKHTKFVFTLIKPDSL